MVKLQGVNKIFYIDKLVSRDIDGIRRIQRQPIFALRDIDIEIKSGEFIVLTGPNGSGKTTLLKIIAGQLSPSRGEVIINSNCDYFIDLPDSPMTVYNFVSGKRPNLDLDPNQIVSALSLGMKAKLMTALMKAELLLLDDFFFATDQSWQKSFFDKHRDKTIIIASHEPENLKDRASKIIFLENGRIKS